jgi:hypothetical protein
LRIPLQLAAVLANEGNQSWRSDLYQVRLRKDHRGIDLIFEVLFFVGFATAGKMHLTTRSDISRVTGAHMVL